MYLKMFRSNFEKCVAKESKTYFYESQKKRVRKKKYRWFMLY